MDDLSAFQRDVLFTLAETGGMSGLGLKADLESDRSETVHHSRLYHNLQWLREDGWISVSSTDGRTNDYSLSDSARARLQERLEWQANQLDQRVVSLHEPEVEA